MSISDKTKRRLWAKSGGFCNNPYCNADLFPFLGSGKLTSIEELAHIIGKSKKGPRGSGFLSFLDRDKYDNIILLCPTCHTLIDKNPIEFPKETLNKWKKEHENRINSSFQIVTLETRMHLRDIINKYLLENFSIYQEHGPNSEVSKINPFSDHSKAWNEKSLNIILPNNRRIINVINSNIALLNSKEKIIYEKFKRHVEDFEFNKLNINKRSNPILFPNEFKDILKDE